MQTQMPMPMPSTAGFVDASRSTVMFSPHLAWRDEPLRARVSSRLTIPVVVDNDAKTIALENYAATPTILQGVTKK